MKTQIRFACLLSRKYGVIWHATRSHWAIFFVYDYWNQIIILVWIFATFKSCTNEKILFFTIGTHAAIRIAVQYVLSVEIISRTLFEYVYYEGFRH